MPLVGLSGVPLTCTCLSSVPPGDDLLCCRLHVRTWHLPRLLEPYQYRLDQSHTLVPVQRLFPTDPHRLVYLGIYVFRGAVHPLEQIAESLAISVVYTTAEGLLDAVGTAGETDEGAADTLREASYEILAALDASSLRLPEEVEAG